MKLHALMLAVALAAAGTAFAQAYGSPGSPGSSGSSAASPMTTEKAPAKVHKKKVSAKAKKGHAEHHASAMHHEHHEMHAGAHTEHHNTRAMGAGPASPTTDLDARARQDRINAAYDDWRRRQARR